MRKHFTLLFLALALGAGTSLVPRLGAQTQLPDAPRGKELPIEPTLMRPNRPRVPPDFEAKPKEVTRHRERFDAAKAKQQASELAALAQEIPPQVDQLSKDVLPTDLIQQLKRIEKLAKHLRKEISR
jgi:hypothetical protein